MFHGVHDLILCFFQLTLRVMMDTRDGFSVAIAIDFGTDGLGVAYALPNDSRIHVHDKWKSKKYGTIVKPKTIILFDENFDVINVGLDAKHTYIDLTQQRDKWMLFERFKMSLFGML